MSKRLTFTITAIILALLVPISTLMISKLQVDNTAANVSATRTVELENAAIDYESILNEFENSTLKTEGSLTTFEGYKPIDASVLSEFDNLSSSEVEQVQDTYVKYNFSYDEETNIVTLRAEMKNENGEIEIEEISGVGFINDKNQIDAVMNIDGESILLSEMNEAGMIQNCGWFKKLIKKVVKAVVKIAVVATVVVATAAVVVATAGAAAPALVAAGVGITTSAGIGVAAGAAAGALFAATVGAAAIQAGTAFSEKIAEDVSQVIDKLTGAIISITIKGVEYAAVLVTIAVVNNLAKESYFLAGFGDNGSVYVSTIAISDVLAVWATRLNIPIYTFHSLNAQKIARDAGDGLSPKYDPAHRYEPATQILKKGIYFDHWHTAKHMGHCLFGIPYINL